MKNQKGESFVGVLFLLLAIAAWLTHVFTCLDEEKWGFLIGGALFFPVAIIHGIGLWFGIF